MVKHPRAEDDTDRGEEFLSRWSRRKAEATEGVPDTDTAPESETVVPTPDPQSKTDADMPPVESIDESTDMRDFFSPEVSERLRQAAFRKLFQLPQFNIVDGLDDYDDDFTAFESLGDIVTADMRHRMELEQEQSSPFMTDEVAEEEHVEDDAVKPADESQGDETSYGQVVDEDMESDHASDAENEPIENDDDRHHS